MKLAEIRKSLSLSQKEVAKRAKRAQPQIARLECHGGNIASLQRYANALGGHLDVTIEVDGDSYVVDVGQIEKSKSNLKKRPK